MNTEGTAAAAPETAQRPPEGTPGANDIVREDGTFDPDRYDDILGTPPEYYPPEQPSPEPQSGPTPQGNGSATGNGAGAGPAGAGSTQETPDERLRRKAKAYTKTYDGLTAGLLAIVANDPERYPAKFFRLDEEERENLTDGFADGIREGKIPEMPWWGAIAQVVGVHLSASIPAAIAIRKEAEQRNSRKPAAPPAAPATPPRKPHPAANDETTLHKVTEEKGDLLPMCAAPGCRNRVKNKRRRFCGPSCAGKVGGKAKKPRKSKEPNQLSIPHE